MKHTELFWLNVVTCLFWRNDDHSQSLNCSFGSRRRKSLVPVREVERAWVQQVQALHQRPEHTDRQSVRAAHWVNVKPHRESEVWSAASPGQLEESVLSILLLGVRGLTVVFIKVGSHSGPADVCVLFALRDLEDKKKKEKKKKKKKKKKKSLVSVRTTKRSCKYF